MKWSKKTISVAAIFGIAATIAFAGPFKDRAGRLFDWWLGGVQQMELYDGQLRVDKISNIAMDAAPDFPDGLNLSNEPTLVAEYMTATTVTGPPVAGKFYSEIVGRQPMLDLSKIPSGKHGVERIDGVKATLITGESGSSGEPVHEIFGDSRVRLIGDNPNLVDNSLGLHFENSHPIEVTFYGTGINLVANLSSTLTGTYSVDGGSTVAFNFSGGSGIIEQRDYPAHIVLPIVSGLSQGVHTVTIVPGLTAYYSGMEILNEATTVAIPAGSIVDNGRKYTTTATTDDLTTFAAEYQDGVASGSSTKGGHQVRYFDTDGTIKKAINYADSTTQLNLSSVDHSNEEVVQQFNWREFGAPGRADDFSTLVTSQSDRAFTLNDGTTTLVGDNIQEGSGGVDWSVSGASLTLTFVGSGLDVRFHSTDTTQPIVSGLPFGTHVMKMTYTSSWAFEVDGSAITGTVANSTVGDFIIYAPKKPVLSAGQVEIDSSYKMADFVINATANQYSISQGVLVKTSSREIVYEGGTSGGGGDALAMTLDVPFSFGGFTARGNHPYQASSTFFGTGVELRTDTNTNRSADVLVQLNGVNATATNFPTATFATNGTAVYTDSTAILDLNDATNARVTFAISGLPLDSYTVKFDSQAVDANDYLFVNAINPITPTYNYKNNLLNLDDALVGSNSLKNEILVPGATKNNIIATAGIEPKASATQEGVVQTGILQDTGWMTLRVGSADGEFTLGAQLSSVTTGRVRFYRDSLGWYFSYYLYATVASKTTNNVFGEFQGIHMTDEATQFGPAILFQQGNALGPPAYMRHSGSGGGGDIQLEGRDQTGSSIANNIGTFQGLHIPLRAEPTAWLPR